MFLFQGVIFNDLIIQAFPYFQYNYQVLGAGWISTILYEVIISVAPICFLSVVDLSSWYEEELPQLRRDHHRQAEDGIPNEKV